MTIEIVAGIALAARVYARRTMCCELLVDQTRDRLIGREPVRIAASEYGVFHTLESIRCETAAERFHKPRGVIRRRTIIRRAEDQDAALGRQMADIFIKGRKLGRETVDLSQISHARRKFFRRAEIGAIQHKQRRVVARPGPCRDGGRCGMSRCFCCRSCVSSAISIRARRAI